MENQPRWIKPASSARRTMRSLLPAAIPPVETELASVFSASGAEGGLTQIWRAGEAGALAFDLRRLIRWPPSLCGFASEKGWG